MKKGGKRAVFKLLWPYAAAIVLLSLFISFTLALKTARVLRQDAYALYAQSLRAMAGEMDGLLVEMDSVAYNIAQDSVFSPYLAFGSGYSTSRITAALKSYMKANTYLADIILYYSENVARTYGEKPRFFTGSGALDGELFDIFHPLDCFNSENFGAYAAGVVRSAILYPVTESKKTESTEYFVYVAPLDAAATGVNARGAVTFLIEREKLINALGGAGLAGQGALSVYNAEGRAVFFTGAREDAQALYQSQRFAALRGAEQSGRITLAGDVSFCLHTAVRGNWYALTLPQAQFPLITNNVLSLFTPLLAAFALTAVALLYLMVRHFVRPILQVTDIIDPAGQGSIVDSVVSSLRSLEEQRSDLIYKIEMQTAFLDIQAVTLLLQGGPQAAAPEHLKEFMSRNEADQYFVLVGEALEARSGESAPCAPDALRKLAEDIPPLDDEKRHFVPLETPGCFVVLACAGEGVSALQYAQRYRSEMCHRAAPGTIVTLACGEAYYSLMETGRAYARSRVAMDQKFIAGTGGVLFLPAREAGAPNGFMRYPVEREREWLRALAAGDAQAACRHAGDILAVLRRERPAQAVAKSLCINLCNRALSLLGEEAQPGAQARLRALSERRTRPEATLDAFEAAFLPLCGEVCAGARNAPAPRGAPLCDRVNAYLEENYANPLLTLNQIAEQFSVSSGHLSRLFSERYNVSVMHRVDMLRMARATELLRLSDQKLSDIIAACGYVDRSNFMRKFKNAYGITPMAFRNRKREDG